MRNWIPLILLAGLLCGPAAAKDDIGFIETFSLSDDRAVALEQLIPGTDDYYYYHCLHYQNTGDRAGYQKFLKLWIDRSGYKSRVKELMYRQALIDYERDPGKALDYIKKELNLRFDHRRQVAGEKSTAPTRLDPARISEATLLKRAFSRHKNLQGIEASGLEMLADQDLNPERRRDLLRRLKRPDYPGLVDLVIADLNFKNSKGFGSHGIHRQLLLDQLEACAKRKPDLLKNNAYIQACIARLQPGADVNLEIDWAAKTAYLERLWGFVERLDPAQNSLKANVLYNRLQHDREQGVYDQERFLAYLKIPRNVSYIHRKYVARPELKNYKANLGADYRSFTGLPPVRGDEALVKDYLAHFLVDAGDFKMFADYLEESFLKRVFAETKIVNGKGNPERWASMLTPTEFQRLKERVDVEFVVSSRKHYRPEDAVELAVDIKNVESLLVKIFEINTLNYYREKRKEVDTAVDLDGMVATYEQRHTYEETPFRRVRRTFRFPQLEGRGVYVVEFIGNGRSSRALIQKGQLTFLERVMPAGHLFLVLDEENNHLTDAVIWIEGHEYRPDEKGRIVIPFSTKPGRQHIVLRHGDFASLHTFTHQGEAYDLRAGFYVDREHLVAGEKARVLLRPVLRINGIPTSVKFLEEVRLIIESVDRDGVSSRKEVPTFELFDDKESVYEFQVPEKMVRLNFTLRARIQNVSKNEKQDLSGSKSFTLNGIDVTEKVEDLHFSREGKGYVAELLGKNGEVRAARPLQVKLKHRYFKDTVDVGLQTDEAGRCDLGALTNIDWLTIKKPDETSKTWRPGKDQVENRSTLQAAAGDVIRVPWMYGEGVESVSLLEKTGNQFTRDRREAAAIRGGFLEITGLAPGNYSLWIKPTGPEIQLKVTEGERRYGYALADVRLLELSRSKPLQITGVEANKGEVVIRLANADERTRVHVVATRFQPEYPVFGQLGFSGAVEPLEVPQFHPRSFFVSGRNIGDEYRYILDRKYAKKYPGNMLERPGLLLNPWSLGPTDTSEEVLKSDEQLDRLAESKAARGGRAAGLAAGKQVAVGRFANVDFLKRTSMVLENQVPDKDGVVRIGRENLAGNRQLQVIAVSSGQTVFREVAFGGSGLEGRDLRMADGLDPERHFTEQKMITSVHQDEAFVIRDLRTTTSEMYDTINKVFTLYSTLSGDATLQEFNFILDWPSMEREDKLKQYSKYACHELNFYLFHKDPEFFKEVIQSYTANKKDKTFMDRWLIGEDLRSYTGPWSFARLNFVERILLGRRLEEQRRHVTRHVKEKYDLIPPNIDRFNRLFDIAVKSSALETEAGVVDAAKALVMAEDVKLETKVAEKELAKARIRRAMPALPMPLKPAAAAPEGATLAEFTALGAVADKEVAHRFSRKKSKDQLVLDEKVAVEARFVGMEKEELDFFFGDENGLAEVARGWRAEARALYRKLPPTEEWAENNYYKQPIRQQLADLVKVNAFWNDYAAQEGDGPFISRHLAEAAGNFTEMMLALAVLDLPYEAAEPEVEREGTTLQLKAGSPTVIFHKEIREAEAAEEAGPMLVAQHFFRMDDRYRYENNERFDKYVSEEFLPHVVYGCQVILTNPGSSRQKLDLLMQLPQGAIPVLKGFYTRGLPVVLEPFSSQTHELYFYFPEVGLFDHYPVHVSRNGKLVAFAPAVKLNVVKELSKIDTASWDYISQNGSEEDVLTYLREQNVFRIRLDRIAFRMKEKAFFRKVLEELARRQAFDGTLWSYGLYHDETAEAREYLRHSPFAQRCGLYIDTELLRLDPVERHAYEHLEYAPLVNARAHPVGEKRKILNRKLHGQYHQFMKVLSYRPTLDGVDWLGVTYYLLLQDRITEALEAIEKVNAKQLPSRLQYDYLQAYLHFFREDYKSARTLVKKYSEHPVPRWRNRFANVLNHLDEAEGKGPEVVDEESREQVQDKLAASEPALEFKVEAGRIEIRYANVEKARINYYPMDIELLFSRNPFVQQQSARFSLIRPGHSQELALPAGEKVKTVELPGEFRNSNVMVEIVSGAIREAQAYYANALSVQVLENYGQVRVTHGESGKPLSRTYVKVYGRQRNGEVKFFKDGYTDLRGRFDYSSVSTTDLNRIQLFSILVLHEEHGAVIREAEPPKQ